MGQPMNVTEKVVESAVFAVFSCNNQGLNVQSACCHLALKPTLIKALFQCLQLQTLKRELINNGFKKCLYILLIPVHHEMHLWYQVNKYMDLFIEPAA